MSPEISSKLVSEALESLEESCVLVISDYDKGVVSSEGANSLKDMGRVIKEVTKQAEGRADGKRIAQEVKSQLQ